MALPNTITADTLARAAQVQENFEYLETSANSRARYLGAWSNTTAYLANDAVSYGGNKWLALLPSTNVTPVEGATWTLLAGTATVADASTTVKGISKLSTAPASSSNPIAVGDNDTRMTNARTPTGSAGGVLSGTYPNPGFAADMATQAELDAHTGAAAPHSGHLKTDGSNAMAADMDMGGFKGTNAAAGVNPTDVPIMSQLDAVAAGYIDLPSAKAMSATNLTLSGAQTVDGVSCVAGDLVFTNGQTTQSENGPWVVASGAWTRHARYDTGDTPTAGTRIFIVNGTNYHGTSWTLLTSGAVIDTDPTAWTQTGAGGSGETNTASNGNSEGVGVYDSKTGVNLVMRGIVSTNALLTAAYNAGTKAIRLTVNEAAFTLNNLLGTLLATKGGTGHSTTTPGDTLTGGAANAWDIVPGNATTTPMYYRQTGDGVDSAAPEWTAIDAADLPVMGASGAGHAPGAVPDTPSTAGISKYLREDGTWVNPSIAAGAGDVVGPASSTNSGRVAFDGTTGKLLKELAITAAELPTGIDAAKLADGSVSNAELQYIGTLTSDAQTQLNGKAATSHTHAASDVTSGTLALARGGTNADLSAGGGAVNTTGKQVLKQDASHVITAAALVAADLPNTAVTPGSYTSTNLTVDAQGRITAAANGTGGSSLWTLIADTTLGSDAADITFSSIAGTYKHLMLIGSVRGAALAQYISAWIRYNGDSGANYNDSYLAGPNGAANASAHSGGTKAILAEVVSASGTANQWAPLRIEIPDYASSTKFHSATWQGYLDSTSNNQAYAGAFTWKSAAAITSIALLPSTGNWLAGSRLTLYGIS